MFNHAAYMRQYRKNNLKYREYLKEYKKQYYQDHREECDKRQAKWREEHKERWNGYGHEYWRKHKDKQKQYYEENKEKILERMKFYTQQHKEKVRGYKKKWEGKARTNITFILNKNMRHSIWLSLRDNKNGRPWESLVGYTVETLRKYLTKTMPAGYCWQDYLEGKLHIDHIIPRSAFNFDRPEHIGFKHCWALGNLQLLPAKENLQKGNKITEPFQTLLTI